MAQNLAAECRGSLWKKAICCRKDIVLQRRCTALNALLTFGRVYMRPMPPTWTSPDTKLTRTSRALATCCRRSTKAARSPRCAFASQWSMMSSSSSACPNLQARRSHLKKHPKSCAGRRVGRRWSARPGAAWQFDGVSCHLGPLHAQTCVRSTGEQNCTNLCPQHHQMTLLNAVLAQETGVASKNPAPVVDSMMGHATRIQLCTPFCHVPCACLNCRQLARSSSE